MKKVQKARSKILIKHAFFGTLLMSTPSIETRDIPTAATDMTKIYYNPDFMESLEEPIVMFVFAHEIMHIVFEHGLRLGGRNPRLWNIAADYAINWILKENGFEIWEHALLDARFAGMTAEQIYDMLQKENAQDKKAGREPRHGSEGDDGAGGMGRDVMAPGNGDAESRAKAQRSIQQRVAQAASMARMAGTLSGGLERLVDEILNPKVPWTDVLRDYMTRVSKDDETWARRNRRFTNVYLPSRHSVRMGGICVINDTSGSIGNDELVKYNSEVNSIIEDLRPEWVRIAWVDTVVAGEQLFEDGDVFKPEPCGGGGTDMRIGLSHVEQYDPQVVILFTDGYTPWPDVEPPYPLIVCNTTNSDTPIGQVIRI